MLRALGFRRWSTEERQLLGLAGLLALGAVGVVWGRDFRGAVPASDVAPVSAGAAARAIALLDGVERWRAQHATAALPTADQIRRWAEDAELGLDPWGRPFSIDEVLTTVVTSAGPDGVLRTADDVVVGREK